MHAVCEYEVEIIPQILYSIIKPVGSDRYRYKIISIEENGKVFVYDDIKNVYT